MNSRRPAKTLLFAVWIGLLGLLGLTLGVALFDLGRWNIVAAMSIAIVKSLLVVLIFMQVRYSTRITWVFVAAGFFWLLLMVTLTMGDYLTRAGLLFF
jgi:cytochrome c oxidase subunit IV